MRHLAIVLLLLSACRTDKAFRKQDPKPSKKSGEWRLKNIRRLTANGTHAEAYWSYDGSKLILMGLREGDPADQIYTLDLETEKLTKLSTGKGKST